MSLPDRLLANCQLGFAPMLKGRSAPIDFSAVSQQAGVSSDTIYSAIENVSEFNLHAYITFFDGKFFAMWSSGAEGEDDAGQRVRYATSLDAIIWSASSFLTPAPPTGFRYFARGFWIREGELLALFAIDDNGPYFGASLELRCMTWSGPGWAGDSLVADDTINNYPPTLLASGDWLISRRNSANEISFLRGDIGDWEEIAFDVPAGVSINEVAVVALDDALMTICRDNAGSKFLYRSFAALNGGEWSEAKQTNFPDARSKAHVLRLADGRVVLASNPHKESRIPLTLAIADAPGDTFNRMTILRGQATTPSYPPPGMPGYQYPHMLEHDGALYVIYSRNKEDIQVSRVSIDLLI